MRSVPDPYRVLGVAREATSGEIKAAHRRLAKRFHPDTDGGDTERFLAVQDAYQVLSDPLARRDWDARHRPGPVRADGGPGGRARAARTGTGRSRARGPATPGAASADQAGRETATDARAGTGTGGSDASGGPRARRGPTDRQRRRPDPFSASGRDPAADGYTWSAQDVPWWTSRSAAPDQAVGPAPGSAQGGQPSGPPPAGHSRHASSADFDVYDRSSGAAWSMASRAYFRRAGSDLPRGAAEPFGQRWTTPPGRPSTGPGPSTAPGPSTGPGRAHAFPDATPTRNPGATPRTKAARATTARPPARAPVDSPPRPSATATATAAQPGVGAMPEGIVFGSLNAAGVRRRSAGATRWPSVGARASYATVGWLALAVGLILGPLGLADPVLLGALAGLAAALAFLPRVAYLAAAGGTAALIVVAGLLLAEAVAGPALTADLGRVGPAAATAAYLAGAALAALGWPVPVPWGTRRAAA